MLGPTIVVDGWAVPGDGGIDLRLHAWSLACDQRAFGPRRLIVAFGDADGRLLALAHARRSDPPEVALEACILHAGLDSAVAVAYCDEPVALGPPPPDVAERFASARALAASYGIHLVDWFACDDRMLRSSRRTLEPGCEWWDVPWAA